MNMSIVEVPSFLEDVFFCPSLFFIPMQLCAVVEKIENKFADVRFPIDIFKVSCIIVIVKTKVIFFGQGHVPIVILISKNDLKSILWKPI